MGDAYQTLPTIIATSFLYLQGSVAGVVLLTLSLLVAVASATIGRRSNPS